MNDAYDDASRRIKIEREDGTYTSYGYNRAGWLVRETRMDSMGTEPEGDDELLWQDEYSYDLAGNRTEKAHTEAVGGGEFEITIQRYKYNHANQLVLEWKETGYLGQGTVAGEVWDEESGLAKLTLNGVTPSMWGSYFYGEAPAGSGTIQLLAEDHVGNQTLIPVKVTTGLSDFVGYTYDENGNLLERLSSEGPTVYQWDHRNRLTKVIHPDGSETAYEYCPACPLGKLAKMTRTDGSTVDWVWDGISFLREEDSQDALPMEYFGGLAVKREDAWYYLHADVMGTIWQVTDEAGQVVDSFEWDAWGNELTGTFDQPGAVCQIGWQGKRWDEEQGLFYSVARWYDQRVGRFTSGEMLEWIMYLFVGGAPLGGVEGRGSYGYAACDPVQGSEPIGRHAVNNSKKTIKVAIDNNWYDLKPGENTWDNPGDGRPFEPAADVDAVAVPWEDEILKVIDCFDIIVRNKPWWGPGVKVRYMRDTPAGENRLRKIATKKMQDDDWPWLDNFCCSQKAQAEAAQAFKGGWMKPNDERAPCRDKPFPFQ